VAENLSRLTYPTDGDGSATHADLRWLGREFGLPGALAAIDPRAAANLVTIAREVFVESTATPAGRRTMVTSRQVGQVRMLIQAAGLDPATATFADLAKLAERVDAVVDPAGRARGRRRPWRRGCGSSPTGRSGWPMDAPG
jgi:hypothetical protein